ncbi:hypothetical protein V6N12_012663 [Hibiscus sabdariffa]|uniref:Uncharacterized protein n=1 Tax=Hibiscus sabdariffa TaxID=183260 RepID=A0ABR2DD87_9ROSI
MVDGKDDDFLELSWKVEEFERGHVIELLFETSSLSHQTSSSTTATSSSLIKVFLNEEIRKKYEEQFSSRPFIFEKSFDTKNELNVDFTPEFMAVVKKHKWESFIQQRGEIYPGLVREFYAHLVTKDSLFLMIRGNFVRFDYGFIDSMFDLSCGEMNTKFL